jgi:hypothetical protein
MSRVLNPSTFLSQASRPTFPIRSAEAFQAKRAEAGFVQCLACLFVALLCSAGSATAQGWGDESEDYSSGKAATTPWSFRAGMGFSHDPDDFLLNFELPYAFDRFISAGPMIQVGLEEDRFFVAPTANLTVTIPDMPGSVFDRVHPNFFFGIGFAVITNDDRAGDHHSAGFLVNTGFGLDYDLSSRVAIGSRMLFNFLPEETLEERFFYSWEVLGVKLSF